MDRKPIKECANYANNFFTIEADTRIKRNTLIIRYEDMALNPMRYSRQVYKFLGQKFSSKIEKMMKNAIEPPATEITDKGRATYTTNRY